MRGKQDPTLTDNISIEKHDADNTPLDNIADHGRGQTDGRYGRAQDVLIGKREYLECASEVDREKSKREGPGKNPQISSTKSKIGEAGQVHVADVNA